MFDSELSKVYAELNILGADIDAQDISKKLGMEIDYVRKEKDYSAQKNNSVSVSPARSNEQYTRWTYKAEEKSTVNINERLDELILVFRNKVQELNDIEDKYDCQINICIVMNSFHRSVCFIIRVKNKHGICSIQFNSCSHVHTFNISFQFSFQRMIYHK